MLRAVFADERLLLRAAEALPAFDRPALVVWAAGDRVMPPEHGRRLATLLPNARLLEIADSYTLIPLDQPAQLAEAIREFARALWFHPAHAHGGLGSGVLRGLKLHGTARVIPDPGRLVDDHHARRPVRVLWFAGSRLDHHFQHPYPLVLQEDAV